MFEILFQDEHYVAIHKPAGILVHRTRFSADREFVLQKLRDQLGKHLYPVHRLDRATAGVLLFALSSEAASKIQDLFHKQETALQKTYWAIVRGYTEQEAMIDYALQEDADKPFKEAQTRYKTLGTTELPFAVGPYPTARYSWVEASPLTGRMHQIRKHFSHIRHPIVGDRQYGDNKHNRFFKETLGLTQLWLLARKLTWTHPYTEKSIVLRSLVDESWERFLGKF